MTGAESSPVVPVREGIFKRSSDGSARLIGSRDRETGQFFWPSERINPVTRKSGTMEPAESKGSGHIVSWTIVRRGLPGFASPYALAAIQLDDGPSLIAQLEDWQEPDLMSGKPVDLVIGTVKTEKDGTVVEGPKFRLANADGVSLQ